MSDWSMIQTDRNDKSANWKELGSLFGLDYEDEEDHTELEDLQSSNEALEQARLADSVDGEVDIDFGTGFDEGSELPEPEAEELMEEDAPGPAKRTEVNLFA